jgi:nucleotide-binding universal stress UspA family protein
MSQRILLGYDGRQEARDALGLAAILAQALEATLVVAKACPEITARGRFSSYEEALGQASAGVLGDAMCLLRRQSSQLEIEKRALGGQDPADGLRDLAMAEEASLIVLGSTHRGKVGRVLPGGTADKLFIESPCPVAIAPRGYVARSPEELRVMGVAFDGDHEARRALAVGVALAERACVGLRVFGVVETVRLAGAAVTPVLPDPADPRFNRDARDRELEEIVASLPTEIGGQKVILKGDPVEALLGTGERAIDLLVLGSHGKGRLLRLLTESISSAVAQAAPWPVIVVPPQAGLAPLLGGERV